jgi:hypothetical protein
MRFTLRAIGAPRLFIAATAWSFTAVLVLAGVLLGLAAVVGFHSQSVSGSPIPASSCP